MDINSKVEEIKEILVLNGIPISNKISKEIKINSRTKSRLGCCMLKDGQYHIEISKSIMNDEKLLTQTIAHELLHTCPYSMNHSARWKCYANIASGILGCSIKRVYINTQEKEAKYILKCLACSKEIKRIRISKAVKNPSKYRCACGGKLVRVK